MSPQDMPPSGPCSAVRRSCGRPGPWPAKDPGTSEDDAHLGPDLAQPRHQQLEDRRAVPGRVDAAGPQVRTQQLLAAEHGQRQVATAVVVAAEEALLLLAMQRLVGGVEVPHQLLRRALEAGDELLHEQLAQASGRGPAARSRSPRSSSPCPVQFGFGMARPLIKTRHLDRRAVKGQCRPRFHGGTVKFPGWPGLVLALRQGDAGRRRVVFEARPTREVGPAPPRTDPSRVLMSQPPRPLLPPGGAVS